MEEETLESRIIKELIKTFLQSTKYKKMKAGQRYYEGNHDIQNKKLNEYKVYDPVNKVQISKINENKSNMKINHKFHTKLVKQKVSYLCSKPITITYNKDNEENNITNLIWDKLGYRFENLIKNKVKEASNKGVAWIHPDYDIEGNLIFKSYSSDEIIPIYDTTTETVLKGIIHFYKIIDVDNQKEKIYVEWWTDKNVKYYIEEKNKEKSIFVEDVTRVKQNCHYVSEIYDNALDNIIKIEKHSWNKVPFIKIANNEEETTDLDDIKELIDAYDLINSNYINTVEDLKEVIWLINGYGAEDIMALIESIKVNGVCRNNDSTGNIDAKTIEIPYEAREALLKKLKEHIYEFGRGVDTTSKDLLNQAPSGVSLKFLYSDLDLKADDIIPELKIAIYDVLWYVLDDLKRSGKISNDINENDFEIEFNKSRIFNENELMQMLNNDTLLSTETKLKLHPKVEDPKIELEKIKLEKEENFKRQQEMFTMGGFDNEEK